MWCICYSDLGGIDIWLVWVGQIEFQSVLVQIDGLGSIFISIKNFILKFYSELSKSVQLVSDSFKKFLIVFAMCEW